MRRPILLVILLALVSCSNSSEFETGEIKVIKLLKEKLIDGKIPASILDTRKIITRQKVDEAQIPVLFMELQNGQNGTLIPYPGEGVGQTWLGADGATITLERGILKATRGMKGDILGSTSSMPSWTAIKNTSKYVRQFYYLSGNNQIDTKTFSCIIERGKKRSSVNIFDVDFSVQEYREMCTNDAIKLNNVYLVDKETIVRKSIQYHGPALGYVTIERLDQ